MEEKNHRLMIDGNAIYEIDLECVRRKEKEETDRSGQKRNAVPGRQYAAKRNRR